MNNYLQVKEELACGYSVTFIPSLSELYQYMEDNKARLEGNGKLASRYVSHEKTIWTGTKTFKEAFDLAETGWANRKTVSKIADQLSVTSTAEIKQATTTMSVAGSYVDIGTYMSGDPNCMVEFEEQDAPKTVRIGFNVSTSASACKRTFHLRGAIVLAMLSKLAESGYSTEIIVYDACHSGGSDHCDAFVLKASDRYMDEDAISFWCSHPSALRRLMFRMNECNNTEIAERFGFDGGSYGQPTDLEDNKLAEDTLNLDINIDYRGESLDSAVEYLNGLVDQINEL